MAPTLITLTSFNGADGVNPIGGLTADASGDLFGTTYLGGTSGAGTVFELQNTGTLANPSYASLVNVLVSFNGADGGYPDAGLTADANGDLFGEATFGGTNDYGTAFELKNYNTPANPVYFFTPSVLMNFNGANGQWPEAGLTVDANGNLFGTATDGGSNDLGTVFELQNTGTLANPIYSTPPDVLVNFNGSNGVEPVAGLTIDAKGDLFGTTLEGGTNNGGTVFELQNTGTLANPIYSTPPDVLVNFNGSNGVEPDAGLTIDANGDLFGTTNLGGRNGLGTVFELQNTGTLANPIYSTSPDVLVNFNSLNGANPLAGLTIDAKGDLFGTTVYGGTNNDGTVFELQNTGTLADPSYSSAPSVLVDFNGSNGATPGGGLTADANGDLFGTTGSGGANDDGTVFEIMDSGYAPCYCAGSRILTERGEVAVEHLAVGDHVVTALSGEARPIKWIGTRSYDGRFIVGNREVLPIRVAAGALGDNIPSRDLWISPHHALYLEGVLIEAKDLVNGVNIFQAEAVERVDYFHIELFSHDVIFAEGAPAETFIDNDSRAMFHNVADYFALYPDALGKRLTPSFAPRRDEGFEIEAARQKIAARAGIVAAASQGELRGWVEGVTSDALWGWALDAGAPDAPVCLHVLADGCVIGRVLANRFRADLRDAGLGCGRHAFHFEAPKGVDFLRSRIELRRDCDGALLASPAQQAA